MTTSSGTARAAANRHIKLSGTVRLTQAGADLSAEARESAHAPPYMGCLRSDRLSSTNGRTAGGILTRAVRKSRTLPIRVSTTRHESGDGPIRDATLDPRKRTQEARHTLVVLHRQDILPPPLGEAGLRPASER